MHRWVFEQVLGRRLRSDEVVMHVCDNPPCFRFDHLRLGSQADNIADAQAKGRLRSGANHGRAKLTSAQAASIAADPRPQRTIAAEYGVSVSAVWKIKTGRTWTK